MGPRKVTGDVTPARPAPCPYAAVVFYLLSLTASAAIHSTKYLWWREWRCLVYKITVITRPRRARAERSPPALYAPAGGVAIELNTGAAIGGVLGAPLLGGAVVYLYVTSRISSVIALDFWQTISVYMVTAARGHSQPPRSHECVSGLQKRVEYLMDEGRVGGKRRGAGHRNSLDET
ncbi:hypothetical protein EVAR_94830_1 [Eumeta japonica]|uniref:Uncharacterized protein n=1 Tax=Eumeta variegata TaxID=151549 RepID=A0A4C1UI37_EUMVA|nr:hypothetical protein EVAR_94830_1 [Eumeta japonica]